MSIQPPEYFESIRQAAERRWLQLDADPELAGPWHQLFKQVQSPRHVLSELLQNADDAGATEASACVSDGLFEFTHNGEDFQPEHFASLCRFGYSNKRSLHTIGFRGIGFKSTFSLGPVVRVDTPTLATYFEKDRFTLPCWSSDNREHSHVTRITVQIEDKPRERELGKNLEEWRKSPVSLLFFRNIRKLTLDDHQLSWQQNGPGPAPNSEWYSLNGFLSDKHLLVRSESEEFPEECVAEIRQERILGADTEFSLPPSRVELVLGASAGIYVVLPTAVRPNLPFACNGPFMQDPARVKIKDPETSPTNSWLLARVGKLAASSMGQWLANEKLEVCERADSYRFLPSGASGQQGIEGLCVREVEKSFFSHLEYLPIVLSEAGTVEHSGKCISLDKQVRTIWPEATFSEHIDPNNRRLICEHIPSDSIETLYRMGQIDRISRTQLCSFLRVSNPPHPGQEELLALWVYLSGEFVHFRSTSNLDDLAIVPITGKSTLYPPRSSVRLSTAKSDLSDKDSHLISSHILILDKEWSDFLQADTELNTAEQGHVSSISKKAIACSLLKQMGLYEGADTNKLMEKVVSSACKNPKAAEDVVIRMAYICARLDCRAPKNLLYITESGSRRYLSQGVCHDADGRLRELLPKLFFESHFLSVTYGHPNDSCTQEEWQNWLSSPKAGLKKITPLDSKEKKFKHSKELLDYIRTHYQAELNPALFPHSWEKLYPNQRYVLVDQDLPREVLEFWENQNSYESSLTALAGLLLESSLSEWFQEPLLQVYQSNTSGLRQSLVEGHSIPVSWLRRFHQSRCIPDSRGVLCKPSELLRRSEETEPLFGIERFIDKRLDQTSNESILDSLGVSSALPGPQLLLSLLRTLAAVETTPLSEVIRLYEQLDKLYQVSSSTDQEIIIDEFREHKLVFTEQGEWCWPSSVFVSGDGLETAGISTVLSSLKALQLWLLIGVRERPNTEEAIDYIMSLKITEILGDEANNLVKILLKRFPQVIISECGVWLSLAGALQPIKRLTYGLATDQLDVCSLFDDVLDITADLRFLDGLGVDQLMELAGFQDIEASLNYELDSQDHISLGSSIQPQWLEAFGLCVSHLSNNADDRSPSYEYVGKQLQSARIYFRDELRLIPILAGKPVGTPVVREGVVISDIIYVNKLPSSRLANLIPAVLGEHLRSPELQAAASYCFERSRDLIVDYFQANFNLENFQSAKVAELKPGEEIRSPVDSSFGMKTAAATDQSLVLDRNSQALSRIPGADAMVDRRNWPALPDAKNVNSPDFIDHSDPAPVFCDSLALLGPNNSGSGQESSLVIRAEQRISDNSNRSEEDPTAVSQYIVVSRYAFSLGMDEIEDGMFQDKDSCKLLRQRGELFPWTLIGSDGQEIQRFLVKTTPLVSTALHLDSVAFGLLEKLPLSHALLLPNTDESVMVLTGQQVQEMIRSGRIKVFPASYRLALT